MKKINKKLIICILIFIACLFLAGCDDNDDTETIEPIVTYQNELSLNLINVNPAKTDIKGNYTVTRKKIIDKNTDYVLQDNEININSLSDDIKNDLNIQLFLQNTTYTTKTLEDGVVTSSTDYQVVIGGLSNTELVTLINKNCFFLDDVVEEDEELGITITVGDVIESYKIDVASILSKGKIFLPDSNGDPVLVFGKYVVLGTRENFTIENVKNIFDIKKDDEEYKTTNYINLINSIKYLDYVMNQTQTDPETPTEPEDPVDPGIPTVVTDPYQKFKDIFVFSNVDDISYNSSESNNVSLDNKIFWMSSEQLANAITAFNTGSNADIIAALCSTGFLTINNNQLVFNENPKYNSIKNLYKGGYVDSDYRFYNGAEAEATILNSIFTDEGKTIYENGIYQSFDSAFVFACKSNYTYDNHKHENLGLSFSYVTFDGSNATEDYTLVYSAVPYSNDLNNILDFNDDSYEFGYEMVATATTKNGNPITSSGTACELAKNCIGRLPVGRVMVDGEWYNFYFVFSNMLSGVSELEDNKGVIVQAQYANATMNYHGNSYYFDYGLNPKMISVHKNGTDYITGYSILQNAIKGADYDTNNGYSGIIFNLDSYDYRVDGLYVDRTDLPNTAKDDDGNVTNLDNAPITIDVIGNSNYTKSKRVVVVGDNGKLLGTNESFHSSTMIDYYSLEPEQKAAIFNNKQIMHKVGEKDVVVERTLWKLFFSFDVAFFNIDGLDENTSNAKSKEIMAKIFNDENYVTIDVGDNMSPANFATKGLYNSNYVGVAMSTSCGYDASHRKLTLYPDVNSAISSNKNGPIYVHGLEQIISNNNDLTQEQIAELLPSVLVSFTNTDNPTDKRVRYILSPSAADELNELLKGLGMQLNEYEAVVEDSIYQYTLEGVSELFTLGVKNVSDDGYQSQTRGYSINSGIATIIAHNYDDEETAKSYLSSDIKANVSAINNLFGESIEKIVLKTGFGGKHYVYNDNSPTLTMELGDIDQGETLSTYVPAKSENTSFRINKKIDDQGNTYGLYKDVNNKTKAIDYIDIRFKYEFTLPEEIEELFEDYQESKDPNSKSPISASWKISYYKKNDRSSEENKVTYNIKCKNVLPIDGRANSYTSNAVLTNIPLINYYNIEFDCVFSIQYEVNGKTYEFVQADVYSCSRSIKGIVDLYAAAIEAKGDNNTLNDDLEYTIKYLEKITSVKVGNAILDKDTHDIFYDYLYPESTESE